MKRVLQYLPAFAILTFVTPSCEEIIKFKGSAMEPKIVLFSILQPDSVITVYVSKSHAIIDDKYKPAQITNAVVRLYRDGEFVEMLTYVAPPAQSGYSSPVPHSKYVSQGINPVLGSTYKIEVEIPGLRTVKAEVSLPEVVPIIRIDTFRYKQDEVGVYLVTEVRFIDPAMEENYYMLSGSQKDGYYNGNLEEPWYPGSLVMVVENDIYFEVDDEPLIAPEQEGDLFGMYLNNYFNVFNDELISGKQYDLTLKLFYRRPDTTHFEFSHFQIELQSITKDLYLYLLSYSAQMQTRDEIFSEPVPVYTNVENGLGVVGARLSSVATIEIGRYPVEGVNYQYGY